MIFELYRNDITRRPYVKLLFNGNYKKICSEVSDECDFEEFQARLRNYMLNNITEWSVVCNHTASIHYLYDKF